MWFLPCRPCLQAYDSSIRSHGLSMGFGALLLFLWLAVLIVTVVLGSTLPDPPPFEMVGGLL